MTITPKSDNLTEEETKSIKFASQNSKAIFIQQAGALKDDTYLDELRDVIYQVRERSETDDAVSS
jgi:hypothetical protein